MAAIGCEMRVAPMIGQIRMIGPVFWGDWSKIFDRSCFLITITITNRLRLRLRIDYDYESITITITLAYEILSSKSSQWNPLSFQEGGGLLFPPPPPP